MHNKKVPSGTTNTDAHREEAPPRKVELGPTQHSEIAVPESGLLQQISYTNDIIDKQYRSYSWTDLKMQALLTIDGLLTAGVALVAKDLVGLHWAERCIGLSGTLLLFISILICVRNCVPIMHSGIGNTDNLRTIVGITRLSKEEYYSKIEKMTLHDMLQFNAFQIAGMALNTMRGHRVLRWAGWFAGMGAILLVIPIVSWNLRQTTADSDTKSVPPRPALTAPLNPNKSVSSPQLNANGGQPEDSNHAK